jgi:CheY-like chemotaxis protein
MSTQLPAVPVFAAPLKGVRVLVVDDTPDTLEMLSLMLTLSGAQVLVAASAREALAVIERTPPDVLVSDLGMPEMDGFDLVRTLRERGSRMPAVALTGFSSDEYRTRAFESGFQAHLTKPVEPDALVSLVAGLRR